MFYAFVVYLFSKTCSLMIRIGRKTMKNKKGGFGAKLLLVLILMIASAVGGAYGYRVLDGKLAVRDALKAVENVDISDYDTPEQTEIQGYVDSAKKDLETAQTRKEVYEIISKFIADTDKVQTLNEKKLEEALRAAEEAKKGNGGTTQQPQDQSYDTGSTIVEGDDGTEEGGSGFLGSLLGGMSSGSNGN